MAIPTDWAECTLPQMCRMVMGQSPPSSTYNTEGRGLPFFQGKKEFGDRHPRVEVWCDAPNKIAEAESVLMSIRAPVGPTNIAQERSCIGRGLTALHPYDGVDRDYLLYLLRRHERSLSGQGTGSTFDAVTKTFLERYCVHLAPLVEQRAIVAKIESLFSELDQGVAQLEAVRTQLGRYRQSVLKAAFEGRLTAAWRDERRREAEANGEPLPTAADLLARIHAERETAHAARLAAWERAVTAWEAAGGKDSGKKKPRKPAAPKDPPPLTKEELADLPELPEGWVWCRLGLAIQDPQYGTSKKCRYDTPGRSVLRIPNMDVGRIDPSDLKFAEFDEDEAKAYELLPGDVLIIRSNGSVSLVGRPALITDRDTEHLFAGYLVRLRPIAATLHGEFLTQCLLSQRSRLQIESVARSTSGVNNINSGEIRGLVVPVCAPDEQTEIVSEIDARLSVVGKVEEVVATTLKQAEALRQSILKKAFEGRLLSETEIAAVRADPAYEPAEHLLRRIRAEHAAAVAQRKKKGKPVSTSDTKRKRGSSSGKSKSSQHREAIAEYLKTKTKGVTPEEVFDACGYTPELVEEFYRELRDAVKAGTVVEIREDNSLVKLVPGS